MTAETTEPAKKGTRKKLLLGVPVLLLAACAALFFTGLLPGLSRGKKQAAPDPAAPAYVDVPELLTNLNVPGKRPAYLKLHAKLEVPAADQKAVADAMPRLVDLFQTYLRDMRPEELRGSEGTYRLREELIGRANVAAAPAHVSDVLFAELVVE